MSGKYLTENKDQCLNCHSSCSNECKGPSSGDCELCKANDYNIIVDANECKCLEGYFDKKAKKCIPCSSNCLTCSQDNLNFCLGCTEDRALIKG